MLCPRYVSEVTSSLAIPFLETDRLRMRGHRLDDFADCCALWGDPLVTRYIGGQPASAEAVWSKILRYVGHWTLLGFGYWVVEERASGRFVGEVGFADFKRDMKPSLDGAPEIGWVLSSWAHGHGFATEAVTAALTWGDTFFHGARTVCLIDERNTASVRVAAKTGYREFGRAEYKGDRAILFERTHA